nr:immunoglobulin heavy chain junction region [Mus musculus]
LLLCKRGGALLVLR